MTPADRSPRPSSSRPAAPVRRSRRGPRRGMRVLAALLSVGVMATSAVGYAAVERYTGKIAHVDAFGGVTDRPAAAESMNILLVGSDNRTGLTRTEANQLHVGSGDFGPPRTDTIMLMHIDASDGGATIVSLPRDSYVEIPAWTNPTTGKSYDTRKDRINVAFERGGAPLLIQTVEQVTGVRIDHYVEANFSGFLSMVDALDGVPVCLPKAVKDRDSGLDLPAGRSVVTGRQALAYVRVRHIDSDFGRMARQQKFLASMLQKATSMGTLLNPIKLNAFLDAAMASVTTDNGLGRDELFSLASRMRGIDQKSIKFRTVPVANDDYMVEIGGSQQSTVLWDTVAAREMFDALKADDPGATPTPSQSAVIVKVSPSKVRVQVYNASGIAGLGRRASDDLEKAGFVIAGPAETADRKDLETTQVRYDPAYDQSAATVAAAITGAELVEESGLGRTISVLVGSGYAGTQPLAVAPTTTAAPSSPTKPRTAADDICT